MQILEDLYLGDVRPGERTGKRNAQYRKALDEAIRTTPIRKSPISSSLILFPPLSRSRGAAFG